jgi:hypothetical protein
MFLTHESVEHLYLKQGLSTILSDNCPKHYLHSKLNEHSVVE